MRARSIVLVGFALLLLTPSVAASHAYTHAYVVEGRVLSPNGPLQRGEISVLIAAGDIIQPVTIFTDCHGDYHYQYHLHELEPGITLSIRHGEAASEIVPLDLELRKTWIGLTLANATHPDPACSSVPSWSTMFSLHARVLRDTPNDVVDGVLSEHRQELDTSVRVAIVRDDETIVARQGVPGRYGDLILDLPIGDLAGAAVHVSTQDTVLTLPADPTTRRADVVLVLPPEEERSAFELALLFGAPIGLAGIALALWLWSNLLRLSWSAARGGIALAIVLMSAACALAIIGAAWDPAPGGGEILLEVNADEDGISARDLHTIRLLTLAATRDAVIEDVDLDAAPFLMAPLALDPTAGPGKEVVRLYGVNTRSVDVAAFGSDFYWFPTQVEHGRHVYAFGEDADVVVLGAAAHRQLFQGTRVGDEIELDLPPTAARGLQDDPAPFRVRIVGILAATGTSPGPDHALFMPARAMARHAGAFDDVGPRYTNVGISLSPVPPSVLARADEIADRLSVVVGGAPVGVRVNYDAPESHSSQRTAVVIAAGLATVAASAALASALVRAGHAAQPALLQLSSWGKRAVAARFVLRLAAFIVISGTSAGLAVGVALVLGSETVARLSRIAKGPELPSFAQLPGVLAVVLAASIVLIVVALGFALTHLDRKPRSMTGGVGS